MRPLWLLGEFAMKKNIIYSCILIASYAKASYEGHELSVSGNLPTDLSYHSFSTKGPDAIVINALFPVQTYDLLYLDNGDERFGGAQFCGTTTIGLNVCDQFIAVFPGFWVDIFQLDESHVQIDASFIGYFDDFSITLDGFDLPNEQINSIAIKNDQGPIAILADASGNLTLEDVYGNAMLAGTSAGSLLDSYYTSTPLGSSFNPSHTSTSVSFSLPSGQYSNGVSIILDTSPIPIPSACWLFLSALAGIFNLKHRIRSPESL